MRPAEFLKLELKSVLEDAFKDGNVEQIKSLWLSLDDSEPDKRMVLDQLLRDSHMQLVKSQTDVSIWESYITFSIQVCRLDVCTPTAPVVLLGDTFDAVTLDQCPKLFEYVENSVDIWKEKLFFLPCKNNMLRMCNDLLRRLSQSQDTYFCGRILLFLAKFFPFSERSGLNIVSEFNLENSTEFKTEDKMPTKDLLSSHDDILDDGSTAEARPKIDFNIYCKFWALQDFFRNPNQCYNKADWKAFAAHTSSVLTAFSSYKLDEPQSRRSSPTEKGETEHQHYFAKYLTNRKLLDLQMSDPVFRRYILVQFLITFQYLSSPVKFKPEGYELKVDQNDWIKETTEAIYRLIEETPPDGAQFVGKVKHILKREEIWNSWKNAGCPAFQKPVGEEEDGPERKKRSQRKKMYLGDLMKEAAAQEKYFMGNAELTKLWNLFPNNLDAGTSKERDFLPSLEGYFEESIQQSDPSSGIEDQYKRVNDGNFGWRALRLLARRSPHFFTHSNNPINKLPEYLETMIKKIAKDIPSSAAYGEIKTETTYGESEAAGVAVEGEVDEDELLKNDMKETDEEEPTKTKQSALVRSSSITQEQISALAESIAPQWKKVAAKFGFSVDDIRFFETSNGTKSEQAKNMIAVWIQDDEDATPENLCYLLEGLEMMEAAKIFKTLSV